MSTLGRRSKMGRLMILPKIRDPRFVTVRRGGRLQDDDHHLLAIWAADCQWQHAQLPVDIRDLVHDDQRWRIFGLHADQSVLAAIALLPIPFWELSLGLWMTFKGFNPRR
jgi:hypothetical protein